MASFIFGKGRKNPVIRGHMMECQLYADHSVAFAGLAKLAKQNGNLSVHLHLNALAIELAFKCLALRAGASFEECKKAGHRISKIIDLIESKGFIIPEDLQRKLSDDKWFCKILGTRYPTMNRSLAIEDMLCFHNDYPSIIAAILEIQCDAPLSFKGGSALAEINLYIDSVLAAHQKTNKKQSTK